MNCLLVCSKPLKTMAASGGDLELSIGQDISIGYLNHDESTVKLYFQESFTFRLLTSEAVVSLETAKD